MKNEKTTPQLTNEYINNHPHIKYCLKLGIINYSSLSRLIAKELKIEKNTSIEAILIATRRLEEKLKKEIFNENKINQLLKKSEIGIKNKICVIILKKNIEFNNLQEIEKIIKIKQGVFYLIEESENYLLMIQEKYLELFEKKFNSSIIKFKQNLSLININSDENIETIPGVIAYLSSLFSQNGVNIIEFISCWKDTLFVVETKDVVKIMNFLEF